MTEGKARLRPGFSVGLQPWPEGQRDGDNGEPGAHSVALVSSFILMKYRKNFTCDLKFDLKQTRQRAGFLRRSALEDSGHLIEDRLGRRSRVRRLGDGPADHEMRGSLAQSFGRGVNPLLIVER